LIKKLYEKEFGRLPPTASTLQTATGTSSRDNVAAAAPAQNDKKTNDDAKIDEMTDNWDDDDAWGDFGEKSDQKTAKPQVADNTAAGSKNERKDFF